MQKDEAPLNLSPTNARIDAVRAAITGGGGKVQIVDSTGNVVGVTGNALDVNLKTSAVAVATSTKQSDGTQKTQIVDGAGAVVGSFGNALDVNLKTVAGGAPNFAKETGGNLATLAAKDFATQTTLAAIKTQTDKLVFAASNLRVVNQTYGQSIGEGDMTGHTKWKVVGYRTALTTTESHLAFGAGGRFVWPAAALTMYVVSSDIDDDGDPADTGARTLQFQGILADGSVATETITLDGTTRVATANQYLCPVIDNCKVLTAGATGANEGTITCYDAAAGGNIMWAMMIGTNQAGGSVYYVPTGKASFLLKVSCAESSNNGAVFRIYQRGPSDTVFVRRDVWMARNNATIDEFLIPTKMTAGTRVEVTGQANAPGTSVCSVKFLGWEKTV